MAYSKQFQPDESSFWHLAVDSSPNQTMQCVTFDIKIDMRFIVTFFLFVFLFSMKIILYAWYIVMMCVNI